jgi:hypothetical protein
VPDYGSQYKCNFITGSSACSFDCVVNAGAVHVEQARNEPDLFKVAWVNGLLVGTSAIPRRCIAVLYAGEVEKPLVIAGFFENG